MTTTIAITGKGGSGKTTIAALLIKILSQKGVVLAIDGDPSTNLSLVLDLPLTDTVGKVREAMAKAVKTGTYDASVAKPDYLELKIGEALVESPKFDLLAMGRPEGPGCYCAANNMLRASIDRMAKNYDYVVIDCEAGMEHISRQTTRDVDVLLIIAEPTMKSIATAAFIRDLIGELRTNAGKVYLIVNRVRDHLPPGIAEEIERLSLKIGGEIPEDPGIIDLETKSSSLAELSPDSPLYLGVLEIAKKLSLV
ncbi:AAA family ATPase [Chloroflexota bacterium]